jgi:citrate lyase subunit beta/citryl-CoA lyase
MSPSPRSYLFVPADRPERIAKALASGADAVIVDLEDAVAPAAKDAAREALRGWLAQADRRVVVRINGVDTPWFDGDRALCRDAGVAAVMLPKAERAGDLAFEGKPVLPLIETAVGIDALREIASAPGVERLVFGSIDFQLDLGIAGDGEELLLFRSQLVLASRLAGLAPPVDGVSPAIDDTAALQADALRARRLGFGAKLCIHPRQVDVVNRALGPSDEELAWARRVLEASEKAGGAAVAVDSRMVDRPVILRAQALLRQGNGIAQPPVRTTTGDKP